jgi:serine phosphatase RsbU (regulator of sigma subunit)
MKHIRIIYVILIMVFLLIAIPVGLSNWLITLKFQDSLEDSENKYQRAAEELILGQMEIDRASYSKSLKLFASEIEAAMENNRNLDILDYVKRSDRFESLFNSDQRYGALLVFNQEGRSTEIIRDPKYSELVQIFLKAHEATMKGQQYFSWDLWNPQIFLSTAIMHHGTAVGSVQAYISPDPIASKAMRWYYKYFHHDAGIPNVIKQTVLIMVGFLLLSLLLGVLLARFVTKLIVRMAGGLGLLRQGDFTQSIPEKGLRETWDMARSYNALRLALAEKARMDQDLLAAREIQMALLPKEKLDVEGWEVWGMCLPAREVGGDFFFWHTRKNRVYAGVGDISGKGMRASLLASLSMGSLKTVFRGEEVLEHSFSVLNDILFHEFKGKGFLCMNAATLTGNSGQIELVNAGQSYPILIKDHKTLDYWVLENGDLPLGAIQEPHYRKDPLVLSEGQGLILYSDGGPEIKNIKGRLLGFDEFIRILQESMDHDLETWGRKIADALTAWRGEAPQHDDITLLFLRFGRKKWKTTRIV